MSFGIGILHAQKKEFATQDETIEYLNQKAKEIVGYNKVSIAQKVFRDKRIISEGHFKRTATGVELYVAYKNPAYTFFTNTSFNPKHILSITNTSKQTVTDDSPIGTLEIKFVGKVALFNNNGEIATVDKTIINFLQTDPANEGRIVKALMHLKTLYMAEDQMFE